MKVEVKVKNEETLIAKIDEAMEHLKKAKDIITWDLAKSIQMELEPSVTMIDDSDKINSAHK